MLESLAAAFAGLQQVLMWPTLGYLLAGVLVGYVVGILPGLGAPAALAFLLPVVVSLAPIDGFVLLTATSAVTAGAGDITSILLGVPGEATAAAIVADGHALAKRGEGRYATGAAISASVMGALFGVGVLVAFIPFAPRVLAHVGSPELAALAIVGICLLVPLSHANPVKGLFSSALGLALATVGLDPVRGEPRFTFSQVTLWDGLGLLPVALGIFAVAEALEMIRSRRVEEGVVTAAGRGAMRGVRESVRQAGLVFRCSGIGAVIGSLPGVGASVTQWIAYAHAQTSARRDTSAGSLPLGSGAIEGVIGPASATTATHGGAMVPTLALGIPGGLASSFLLSALILKGIAPGPTMLLPAEAGGHLTMVFALVWCTVLASAIGAVIGLASLGWVARLATLRPALLFPVILTFVLIGTVGERHATADLGVLLALGGLGYAMSSLKWPRAPLMLAFVLGPLLERRVLLSNTLYGWSWVLRPTVMVLAVVAIGLLLAGRRASRRRRGSAPVAREAAASRADILMSACFALVGAAGLGLSLSLTGRAAVFPRIAFGATFVLALLQLALSWRRFVSGQTSLPAVRGEHLVRIAWFVFFVANGWIFGLAVGTAISAFVYLRGDAKESWRTTIAMTTVLAAVTWVLVVQLLQLSDRGVF
ncbi:MAG TPA: tripartite tricarboxylate transporter permease [Vicinamibacterales bacterium]|nr:tripartite tricarboxylate transporter permease [Vicinamibacterales bacterium]